MMSNSSFQVRPRQRWQRGLSIVELMIGVAVGLFVVAGAIKLTVDSLVNNRSMLLETRLNQDMRAAAEIIARDLRRASYWENATTGLWSEGAPVVTGVNPYAEISNPDAQNIGYEYERAGIAAKAEPLGFRRVEDGDDGPGVIEVRNGGDWQAITDAKAMNVTGFVITKTERVTELWSYCGCRTRVIAPPNTHPCHEDNMKGNLAAMPHMVIRSYDVAIQATSLAEPTLKRELRETVRVRNDELKNPNGCPGA